MWEASYGKEPFDLRLTVLRLIRNGNKILAWTAAGTILFGGGYYVKNVLCGPGPEYQGTSTYKVQYVEEPTQSGDYYINEATWDSLVHTREFLTAVQSHLAEAASRNPGAEATVTDLSVEAISEMITAKLPSDWHIPTTIVTADSAEESIVVAAAVEQAMETEFPDMMAAEVASVKVLDPVVTAKEVLPDVRPLRAVVLSLVLSLLFVNAGFLIKEIGDDCIWLPATIGRRYGIPVLGTVKSPELAENMKYLFRDCQKIAVCAVNARVNPAEVAEELRQQEATGNEDGRLQEQEISGTVGKQWIPVPTPMLSPEVCEQLRGMDGVLLVVKAGAHCGKQLEYVKEMLEQQDCKITAALLWDADEVLIKTYYFFEKGITGKA